MLLRVLAPVLSKMGSLGGTLGMALESRKTMKRIQTGDTHAELTWQELMEESMDYGETNATQHTATSFLT